MIASLSIARALVGLGDESMLGAAGRAHGKSDDTGLGELRARQDRRSGLDRRGANAVPTSATHSTVRAYRFRDFRERRNRQDRRLYHTEGQADSGRFVYLTRDDIIAVLSMFEFDQ